MWNSDLLLVAVVIAVVVLAMAGVVWTDNRLNEDRPGDDEGGGVAGSVGTAAPRTTRHRRLPPEARGSR